MLDDYILRGPSVLDGPESMGFPLHHSPLVKFWFEGLVSIISGSFSSCPSQETVAFLTEGKTAMLGSWHRLYMLWANWSGVPDMDAMGPNKKRIKLHIC